MRILWCTPDFPFGRPYGGIIDIRTRMEFMASRGHEIGLISCVKDCPAKEQLVEANSVCDEIQIVQRQGILRTLPRIGVPFPVSSRIHHETIKSLKRQMRRKIWDVVCLESTNVGELARHIQGVPCVLRLHNREGRYFRELGYAEANIGRRLLYFAEAKRFSRFEDKLLSRVNGILAISKREAEEVREMVPEIPLTWLPPAFGALNGLSQDYGNEATKDHRVVFCGSMDVSANVEGVLWFLRNVWPTVRSHDENCSFWVVGKNPSDKLCEIAEKIPGVHITGSVESTVPYLQFATLVVAPLLHGAGVKVKIIEALRFAKPIVATPSAVDGTDLDWESEVMVARSPKDFAEKCIRILKDNEIRHRLANKALKAFQDRYSLDIKVGPLFETFLSLVSGPGDSRDAC